MGEDRNEYMTEVNEKWRPNLAVICRVENDSWVRSPRLDAMVSEKSVIDNQPKLYVCEQFACQTPVVGKDAILDTINQL